MDQKQLGELRTVFESELAQVAGQLSALDEQKRPLERRKAYLEGILGNLDGLATEKQPLLEVQNGSKNGHGEATNGRPKSYRDALLTILAAHGGRTQSLTELLAEMRGRGWIDADIKHPLETLRHTANVLAERDQRVKRIGKAKYRFLTPTTGGSS